MNIKGKEYKKIVSICSKCHLISDVAYIEYKSHYIYEDGKDGKDFFTKAGKFCGNFELYVETGDETKQIAEEKL